MLQKEHWAAFIQHKHTEESNRSFTEKSCTISLGVDTACYLLASRQMAQHRSLRLTNQKKPA